MINNRQNGRRRGRGGNGGGGNGQRGGNPGRPDSGNRIDSRARGNANQLYEKYKNLARDAQMSGDRVNTEYYLQFADHYFRVLSESRLRFQEQNPNQPAPRRIQPVDSFDDFDGDDEFGDEGEPIRAGDQDGRGDRNEPRAQEGRGEPRGQDGPRFEGQRGQREGGQREGREQGSRQGGRRDDGSRFEAPRVDARRDEPRGDADYRGGMATNGAARDDEESRPADRYAMTGSPIANDLGEDSPDGAEPSPVAPRRRGRPRRVEAAEGAEAPAALEADRLPPSLSMAPVPDEADEEAPRPRRRRARAAAGEASSLG